MQVKVYSTLMGEKTIETSATTWGDLKSELNSEGIKFDKMKAVIGETKHTLEADGASLPKTGFTLFLMNKKTKAGADVSSLSYKELRGTIKVILSLDNNAKDHFNVGKNYTTKGTEVLRNLLATYSGIIPSLEDVANYTPAKKSKSKAKAIKPKEEVKVVTKPDAKERKLNDNTNGVNGVVEALKSKAKDQDTDKVEKESNKILVVSGSQEEVLSEIEELLSKLNKYSLSDISADLDVDFKNSLKEIGFTIETAKVILVEIRAEQAKVKAAKEARERAEQERIKAEEEAEAKARAEQEAKDKAEKEAMIRQAEAKAKEEENLKGQFNDLFGEFSDVKR